MPYSIAPALSSDCPELSEVFHRSQIPDGIQPYMAATWPYIETPEGRAEAASRFSKILTIPSAEFLKIVDVDEGRILGFAVVFPYAKGSEALVGFSETIWKSAEEREFARVVQEERNKLLLRTIAPYRDRPVTEILAFFVDGEAQGKGVGRTLMEYVVGRREGPVVLMANPTAKGFYEKCGFRIVEEKRLDVGEWEGWAGGRSVGLVGMVRD